MRIETYSVLVWLLTMTEILLPQQEMILKKPLTEKWKHPRNKATFEMKLTKRNSMAEDVTARQLITQLNLFHSFENTMSGFWKYVTRHHCSHQQDEPIWLQAICGFPLKLSQKILKEACLSACVCLFLRVCRSNCQLFGVFREVVRETGNSVRSPPPPCTHTHTHTHTYSDTTSGGNVSMSPSVWSFPITPLW